MEGGLKEETDLLDLNGYRNNDGTICLWIN
jgi:hypothetical protein